MIKIGDFARLSQVSVVTLRYYDEIDTLFPFVNSPAPTHRGRCGVLHLEGSAFGAMARCATFARQKRESHNFFRQVLFTKRFPNYNTCSG
jgi:hypothetical protein